SVRSAQQIVPGTHRTLPRYCALCRLERRLVAGAEVDRMAAVWLARLGDGAHSSGTPWDVRPRAMWRTWLEVEDDTASRARRRLPTPGPQTNPVGSPLSKDRRS